MPKGQYTTDFQHLIIEKERAVFFFNLQKKKNCLLYSIGSWQAGTVWTP
jgi:hypothetical protein